MESVPVNLMAIQPEPRVFTVVRDGRSQEVRVSVIERRLMVAGRALDEDSNGGRTHKRMYREEVARLKEQRRFLHYNPRRNSKAAEYQRALSDIRALELPIGPGTTAGSDASGICRAGIIGSTSTWRCGGFTAAAVARLISRRP